MGDFFKRLQLIKQGSKAPEGPKKFRNKIAPVGAKKKAEQAAAKKALNGEDSEKWKWFKKIGAKLTGMCGCGCGNPSEKYTAMYHCSCAHIFPKTIFKSIQYHPLNYVERSWENKCHEKMDTKSLDKWPKFADWELIVSRYYKLVPFIPDSERKHKFFKHLTKLVNAYTQSSSQSEDPV